MEGKNMILSVLVMSLVMGQIHVDALYSCCPSIAASDVYNTCRVWGFSMEKSASASGCKLVPGNKCPKGYPYGPWSKGRLENSGETVKKYCELGCVSTTCNAMTALQNTDASEIVNAEVKKCTEACSTFCTKGSISAIEAA